MRRFALLAVVVLGALASVTAAQAGTITIGNAATPLPNAFWFNPQEVLADGYVVPAGGGTIVSLNTQSVSDCLGFVGGYNLQVPRPLGRHPVQGAR